MDNIIIAGLGLRLRAGSLPCGTAANISTPALAVAATVARADATGHSTRLTVCLNGTGVAAGTRTRGTHAVIVATVARAAGIVPAPATRLSGTAIGIFTDTTTKNEFF